VELEFQAGRALTIEQRKKVQQYLDINGDVNVKAFFSSTETRKRDNCEKLRARYIPTTPAGDWRGVERAQESTLRDDAVRTEQDGTPCEDMDDPAKVSRTFSTQSIAEYHSHSTWAECINNKRNPANQPKPPARNH
jgi:hypothetical protein